MAATLRRSGSSIPLGNHPLLIGIVAGLVRDYRAEPGGFDRWLADPTAGGALRLPDLDLTQRRTHILAAALDGLEPGSRRLLGWISVLAGAVSWATLESINPFRPEPPAPVGSRCSVRPVSQSGLRHRLRQHSETPRKWNATRGTLAAWRSSEPVMRATAQLGAALKDLEDRGLLWWDRSSNTYDLHPIIRAYATNNWRKQTGSRPTTGFATTSRHCLPKIQPALPAWKTSARRSPSSAP